MFLEIVTRTYQRPSLLAANQASLRAQTDNDWRQSLIVDGYGHGVAWANRMLAFVPVTGRYIWVLDDDDLCILPTFVEGLKAIAAEHNPDVIMVRMDHGVMGILPDDEHWQRPPEQGYIGMSAFVVRRDVWMRHAKAFPNALCGDFAFISDVFAADPEVYWWDVVASQVQRISKGEPE